MEAAPQRFRILVIKHGALGDWILATGCFAAIRRHHPLAHITLLTTPAFADLGERCPYFDEVWTDERASVLDKPLDPLRLRRRLIEAGFARVYDLQSSSRTGHYFRMLPRRRRPEWSGVVAGCSHRIRNPAWATRHSVAVLAEQLGIAGIEDVPAPSIDWLGADIGAMELPPLFSLIVPGGSAHRPEKRWPAERYAELARLLAERGQRSVLIGTSAEAPVLDKISREAPSVIDLCGRTSLAQIAALARRATCAVGNDTGPVHIAATAGCPTLVLFGEGSDPKRSAPLGQAVTVLRRVPLSSLNVEDVFDTTQRTWGSA